MTPASLFPVVSRIAFSAAMLMMASCSSLKPADFAAQRPAFDIEQFYTGHTQSTGLIENRTGEPTQRVTTETWGHRHGQELEMIQDLKMDDKPSTRRTWHIRRLDDHHYEARTDHMIGVATGESWGNTLRMSYTLALKPGNPLLNVRMTHWMVLQPDGRTMLNSVTVTKAGLVVGRISEVFHKEP